MQKLNKVRKEQLIGLSNSLAIKMNDLTLLDRALTHTSHAHEAKVLPRPTHNERLEFLGDSVLSMVVCTYIYKQFPLMPEGEMTKLRAKVVCENALAKYARELSLGQYILLGKGEEASGGFNRSSILADAFEALIGAFYIDQGWDAANQFVLRLMQKEIDSFALSDGVSDYKTKLQEVVQQDSESIISYSLIAENGPDHNKLFKMAVLVNNQIVGTGEGHSKKEAEQLAACQALQLMGELK